MNQAILIAVCTLIGSAFTGGISAGIIYSKMNDKLVKATGDVNGLGRKYYRVIALLIRWADTDEKREQLAQVVEPPK
jgi:hypothetical protein